MHRTDRRGVTLVELLLGLVLASILGVSLLRITVTQSRFNDRMEAGRSARSVARTAVNYLSSELRMTDAHDGVVLANANQLRVREPYAVGLMCTVSGTQLTAVFMPVDSMLDQMGYSGIGVRGAMDGQYTYYAANGTLPSSPGNTACTSSPANMTVPTGARVLRMTTTAAVSPLPAVATPVTLYRFVEFSFENSTAVPGRRGLYRKVLNSAGVALSTEELVAPFDSTARFRFFILNNRIASDTVPTALADMRGIEIRLAGESERTVRGQPSPEQANQVTSIFFLNRLD
jgi:hypothetical protein